MSYINDIIDPDLSIHDKLIALKEVEHDLDTQRQNSNFSFPMRQQLQREWFAVVQEINRLTAELEPKTGVPINTIFCADAITIPSTHDCARPRHEGFPSRWMD